MKTYSITTHTFFSALKHQWKTFLAAILVFSVLGAAGGGLFSARGSSETGGGGAQALPEVDFQTVAYTQSYYTDCYQALLNAFNLLDSYMSTAFTLELPEEIPLAETLLKRQAALNLEKREFQQTVLVPLLSTLQEPGTIYVPEEFLDDLPQQYERYLATVRMDLIASETSVETLRQMSAPNYDNNAITANYTQLLSEASQYGTLLKNQAVYETILDQLQNEPERVLADSRRIQRELNAAAQTLNTLMADVSQTVAEIALTSGIFLRLERNEISYDVILDHTFLPVSTQESFIAIELFCVLVGICTGAFFAVCREAKVEKLRSSSKSQESEIVL